MPIIYDPVSKTHYNSDFADATVKQRAIPVANWGDVPGSQPSYSQPTQTFSQPSYTQPSYQPTYKPTDVSGSIPYYRQQIASGALDPHTALNQLQSAVKAPVGAQITGSETLNAYNNYLASLKTQLFQPMTIQQQGRQAGLNADGSFSYNNPYIQQSNIGAAGGSTTTNLIPSFVNAGATPTQATNFKKSLDMVNNIGTIERNLTPGMSGNDVRSLQQFLIDNGFQIKDGATGYYGPQTKAAVEQWQRSVGINAGNNYGYFGPLSKQYLLGQQGAGSEPPMSPMGNPQSEYADPFRTEPSGTVPSTALSSSLTTGDVMARANQIYQTYQNYINQQMALQQQLNAKQQQLRALETQATQEITKGRGETIPLGIIGAQEQNIRENLAFRQIPITNEIQALSDQIGTTADLAATALEMAKLAEPQTEIITNTDENGNVTAVTVDARTGQIINKAPLGNIGKPQKEAVNNQIVTTTDAQGNVSITTVDRSSGQIVGTQVLSGAGKPSPVKSGSSGSGGGGNFTQTQINKGAANAGVSIDAFKKFSSTAKNTFINGFDNIKKAVETYKKAIESGERKKQDIINTINSSSQPQEVKDYIKRKVLDFFPPVSELKSSQKSGVMGTIKNFFSNIF